MSEANVANTTLILGRTNTLPVYTHWQSLVYNDPTNRAALKINSLFITNRAIQNVFVDLRLARHPQLGANAIFNDNNYFHYMMSDWVLPPKTTVVAISRDNPIYLQPGDFLQIAGSLNFCLTATCSYEFISDESPVPQISITAPEPVLNLNVAPGNGTGGVQLTWTPPLVDGGAAISNYLVLCQRKMFVASPYTEYLTPWELLETPVSAFPTLTTGDSIPLASPRSLNAQSAANGIFYSSGSYGTYAARDLSFDDSDTVAFRFAVAARNAMGLSDWIYSDFIRVDAIGTIGAVEDVSIASTANGAVLDWTGNTPTLTPASGATLTISNYRIRWSNDNGMTWLPTPDGVLTNSINPSATIRGLQNGVEYVFSLQTICTYTKEGNSTTLAGPWSPNTLPVTPMLDGGESLQAQDSLRAMFVRWE